MTRARILGFAAIAVIGPVVIPVALLLLARWQLGRDRGPRVEVAVVITHEGDRTRARGASGWPRCSGRCCSPRDRDE